MNWSPPSVQFRWAGWLLLLSLTVWLSLRSPSELGAPLVEVVPVSQPTSNLDRRVSREFKSIETAKMDPFSVATLPSMPPPSPKAADPPPLPVPPPLPFRHFGALTGPDGKETVYVAAGDRLLVVRPGEVLDGQYRVDKVSEEEIVFTYLPLEQAQSLRAARQ